MGVKVFHISHSYRGDNTAVKQGLSYHSCYTLSLCRAKSYTSNTPLLCQLVTQAKRQGHGSNITCQPWRGDDNVRTLHDPIIHLLSL